MVWHNICLYSNTVEQYIMKHLLTILFLLTLAPLNSVAQISLDIRTDNSSYGYGNAAQICLDITNTSNETIQHEVQDCQFPIQIDDDTYMFNQYRIGACPMDCSQSIQEFVIPAGETISICSSFWMEDQNLCSAQSPYSPDVNFTVQDRHTITAFGREFDIHMGGLAVEYESVSAFQSEEGRVIEWSTLSETNNLGFEVEKLNNGEFVSIGFVEGHGSTLQSQSYRFVDPEFASTYEVSRYRLKQIDSDGSHRYSKEIELLTQIENNFQIGDAFPNPFVDSASFSLSVKKAQDLTVKLYDDMGREIQVVWEGYMRANETRNLNIYSNGLAAGTYFYHIEGEHFSETKSISVSK